MSDTRPALWGLPAVFAMTAGLATLWFPLGRVHGSAAFAAWRWNAGGVPYRDFFVADLPGTVTAHMIGQRLYGLDPMGLRLFDLTVLGAFATALAVFVHRAGLRQQAGVWGGVAAVALYLQGTPETVATSEAWACLPLIGAALALQGGAPLWAGLALSLGFTLAPLSTLLAIALVPLIHERAAAGRLVGGAMAGIVFVGLVLMGANAWAPLMRMLAATWAPQVGAVPLLLWVVAGIAPPLAAWTVRDQPRLRALLLLAWLVAFPLGWLKLFPAALASGVLLDALRARVEASASHLASVGAVWGVVAAVMLVSPYRGHLIDTLGWLTGSHSRSELWARDPWIRDREEAAAWIAGHSDASARVFDWTSDPALLYRANRRPVSRYVSTLVWAGSWAGPSDDEQLDEALENAPPALVVVGGPEDAALLDAHPVLQPMMEGYCLRIEAGTIQIYEPCGAPLP